METDVDNFTGKSSMPLLLCRSIYRPQGYWHYSDATLINTIQYFLDQGFTRVTKYYDGNKLVRVEFIKE